MARDPILVDHGTPAFTLPPTAVVTAAERDLAKAKSKRVGQSLFVKGHLTAAKTVPALLRFAIDHRTDGTASPEANTKTVYGTPGLLEAALELALTKEAR